MLFFQTIKKRNACERRSWEFICRDLGRLEGINQGAFLYLFNPLLYRHGIDRMSRPIHKKIYLNFENKNLCIYALNLFLKWLLLSRDYSSKPLYKMVFIIFIYKTTLWVNGGAFDDVTTCPTPPPISEFW